MVCLFFSPQRDAKSWVLEFGLGWNDDEVRIPFFCWVWCLLGFLVLLERICFTNLGHQCFKQAHQMCLLLQPKVASTVGIDDVRASCMPEQKAALVQDTPSFKVKGRLGCAKRLFQIYSAKIKLIVEHNIFMDIDGIS